MKTKFLRLSFRKLFRRDSLCRRAVAALVVFNFTLNALANPTGMTVSRGAATLSISGSTLNVTVGNNAVLNWQHFNIGSGEMTVFNQPSSSSIVWNRINDPNPSQIYGSLQANGVVVLLNSSGFYFGPNSFVSAAGLVVSTANCAPPQNMGGAWQFNGPPPLASIVNYGQIKIGNGGDCFFIADKVENHGSIEAPGGNIGFAAGQTVTLSERPDGRGMSMAVTLPQGSVDNYGNVIADGGTIALNAKVVNQNGLLQANSIRNQNGIIELVASDTLNLGADSKMLAAGDDSASGSAGGSVTLQSGNIFSDAQGSTIITTGGVNGGNGGNVEVSAPNIQSLETAMDARAQAGYFGGEFLLDPVNIILGTSGAGAPDNSGSVAYNSGSGTLNINVNTAFANKNFSNIKLQATGNITLAASTTWNLSTTTGQSAGQLTMQAGGDIIFGTGAKLTDANNWSVSLQAGYSFVNNAVTYGTGNIYFGGANNGTGTGALQLGQGLVNLIAGNTIQVGAGYVVTTGGGSITAHALKGGINTGSSGQGYFFNANATTIDAAYNLSHDLGGISTMAGGDVNLTAGGDITSVLPGKKGYFYNGNFVSALNNDYTTAGSGAFGPQAGNVNIVAGGNVTGHYLVANGIGSILAGVKMDANGNPLLDGLGHYQLNTTGNAGTSQRALALSLINGGWNVTAGQNIYLQEVRNPNGIFNISGNSSLKHYFDYGLNDFVNLSAGNTVQLGGTISSLPRLDTLNVPVIYPGIVNVTAGAGGVSFVGDSTFNQLILFPTPTGNLAINTTGGGSLVGSLPTVAGAPQIFNLVVSDSAHHQYVSSGNFGVNDHSDTPVHLGSENPVQLNISGDMNLMSLISPEAAQINVVGNMNNSRFQGMNLSNSDTTRINVGQAAKTAMENSGILNPATDGSLTVGGDINNRSSFTSIDLSQVAGADTPDLSVLGRSQDGSISAATLLNSIYYNPTTHLLTYQNISGVTISQVMSLLQNLTVQKVDSHGNLLWLDLAQTIPDTEVVSVVNAATATAMIAQYNALGAVPGGNLGYVIGGGGKLEINARNLDLGTTSGIQSKGVGFYSLSGVYPLAKYFTEGADIDINLTGDLNMYSSAIASLNGGSVTINAGGDVNAGSSEFNVTSTGARGIYTSGHSDVTVIAGGNVNVNGSRIAAYDGGNVTVESLFGDITAGTGGGGFAIVNAFYVDPVTHQVYPATYTIPGSGILATTFPARDLRYPAPSYTVGNILVETPNGNINASAGGIIQLPLNGENPTAPVVEVLAGYELRDGNGHAVDAAHISDGKTIAVLSPQNLVGFGSVIQVLPVGTVTPVSLTQLLDGNGNPRLDANGQPLYVQVLDSTRQVVQWIGGQIQAFHDGNGNPVNVAQPKDPDGNLLNDSHGNPVLVMGRNIDASGSGIICQNAVVKATGTVKGVIFSKYSIDLSAPQVTDFTGLGKTITADGNLGPTVTLIGTEHVDTGGPSTANILSSDANGGGSSFAAGTAANATSQGNSAEATSIAAKSADGNSDADTGTEKKSIGLAAKVSRVTVLLPGGKKVSEVSGKEPKL
jgi:filamentous hemagglutinin family protein